MWETFINFLIVYGAIAFILTIIEYIIKPILKIIQKWISL